MSLVVVGLAVLVGPLFSVSVSPMAVYMSDRERTGTMTLYNPGSRPEEIEIDFAFGYPQTDADGNLLVPLSEEPAPAGEPSAVPWLSAFPRRLVLEPGQRQVVRVLARPPAGLADGEYWARALVRSRGGQEPIEARQGDVDIQIDVETLIVVAVNYRNGEMSTGVRVTGADAELVGDTTVTRISLERTGNAAFLGRLLIEALDERGDVITSSEQVLAVYRTLSPRLVLPTPADGRRPVELRYTLDTERNDLPPGGALPMERVVYEAPVR
ncbi:MAG: hypothetical protein AB7T31_04595 [Gemmatimonadales bacterium]